MYSPKIKNDLIPILFRLAQDRDKSMTVIVDEILRPALIGCEDNMAIPYCVRCYSKVETEGKLDTAYCKLCDSETFVLYRMPLENVTSRKEVI
jgi:hypothetical protein